MTEPIAGVPKNLPTLRDPDRLIYFKEDVGGLVMGGYEPNPIPWAERGIPEGFEFQLLTEDWDHFEPIMTQALARVPALQTRRHQATHQRSGVVHAGRQFHPRRGPRSARVLRRRRFQRVRYRIRGRGGPCARRVDRRPASRRWTCGRSTSAASAATIVRRTGCARARSRPTPSTTRWPGRSRSIAARGRCACRRYTRGLKDQGACFGEKLGWERPNWFAPPWHRAEGRLHVRPPELVCARSRRA